MKSASRSFATGDRRERVATRRSALKVGMKDMEDGEVLPESRTAVSCDGLLGGDT